MTAHDLNRLAAFVENRLSADERQSTVAHLAECAECRGVVAGLAREQRALAAERPVEPRRLRPAVWLPLAASIAVAAGAGWLVWSATERQAPAPTSDPGVVAPTLPPVSTSPPVTKPTPPAPPTPPDTTRAAGEREIAGHRFRLEAGAWIDRAYDPFALLPAVDVRTTAERDALVAREPGLRPFLALGRQVTVVHAGTVYRFDLPR